MDRAPNGPYAGRPCPVCKDRYPDKLSCEACSDRRECYEPTEEEILETCEKIRMGWSEWRLEKHGEIRNPLLRTHEEKPMRKRKSSRL